MKRNHWTVIMITTAAATFWLASRTTGRKQAGTIHEDITVIAPGAAPGDTQPDLENYRFEREQLLAHPDIGKARILPECSMSRYTSDHPCTRASRQVL